MRRNLAARAGRWSASHWKTATFGWLAFVAAAVFIGGAVGTKHLGANDGLPGESGRAEQILKDDFEQPSGEMVLVQSSRLTTGSPAFTAATQDIERRLAAIPVVTNIRSPFDPAHAGQVSRTGTRRSSASTCAETRTLLPTGSARSPPPSIVRRTRTLRSSSAASAMQRPRRRSTTSSAAIWGAPGSSRCP